MELGGHPEPRPDWRSDGPGLRGKSDMSPLNWMFQGLVVALFALCSLLLGKSPPEFARRATSFLCWCKERRQRKHLKTHLASSQSGCSTTGDRPQLASRLEQFPLDARRTFHESAAHTSPHGKAAPHGDVWAPRPSGVHGLHRGNCLSREASCRPATAVLEVVSVSSLGQMGFQVLSFASFSLHQQRKGGRRPGEIRRALPQGANAARE